MKELKTIYHGSFIEIKNPELNYSIIYSDFGLGFYCTKDIVMAEKWAVNKTTSVVNVYDIDLSGLKIHEFQLSKEWLDFVVGNRNQYFIEEDNNEYDVIIGPIVDDKMFRTINDYEDGLISGDMAIQLLNCGGINTQYCFKTEKAIDALQFKESITLDKYQKKEIRLKFKKDREKTEYSIKEIIKMSNRTSRNGGRLI